MNEHLHDLITSETISSYSNACVKLSELLLNLKNENYKRIIIPSRGAYPFYYGANTALHQLADMSEMLEINQHFSLWLLPYTSDWGQTELNINSKSIRAFWTKIPADSIRKITTPYTKFYNSLVDNIGEQLTINTTDLKLDKYYRKDNINSEKFIFIDTAISGKAITDIIESFINNDLEEFLIIMIADENGSKLKSNYKTIIEREKIKGRLIQLNVSKIYSEDASPLMNTGISSIVFPSLIERAFDEIEEFQNDGICGGGIWFIDSVSHLRETFPKLNGIRGILSTLNYMGIVQNFGIEHNWFDETIKKDVNQMIEWLDDYNLLDESLTKKLVYDRIKTQRGEIDKNVDVTGSHIIRVSLNDKSIDNLNSSHKCNLG